MLALYLYLWTFLFSLGNKEEPGARYLLEDSFEYANFMRNWKGAERCCDYSITRSDSVARTGRYSLRFELNKGDLLVAKSKRAELKTFTEKTPDVDRWYRFSTFLPDGYELDSVPEIIAQWHEIPDFKLGENWRSPPIALQTSQGQWRIRILSSSDEVNTNRSVSSNKHFDLGDTKTGVWTDWIFHIHFSHDNDGVLQIWKDSKSVLDYSGPNYYNDRVGPYFKIGIYKWGWNIKRIRSAVTKRVIYIDDVKIADQNSSLQRMIR